MFLFKRSQDLPETLGALIHRRLEEKDRWQHFNLGEPCVTCDPAWFQPLKADFMNGVRGGDEGQVMCSGKQNIHNWHLLMRVFQNSMSNVRWLQQQQRQICQILTWSNLHQRTQPGGHGMRPGEIKSATEEMRQRCGFYRANVLVCCSLLQRLDVTAACCASLFQSASRFQVNRILFHHHFFIGSERQIW